MGALIASVMMGILKLEMRKKESKIKKRRANTKRGTTKLEKRVKEEKKNVNNNN
jgi:hypothetical protein